MTASRVSPVRTSSPPMTHGMSSRWRLISARRFWRLARSGDPGAYDLAASFVAGGGRKIPGAVIRRHCMAMEVVAYEAPGWGVGELYLRSGVLLYHELPRAAAQPAPVRSRASHASRPAPVPSR